MVLLHSFLIWAEILPMFCVSSAMLEQSDMGDLIHNSSITCVPVYILLYIFYITLGIS